MKRRLTTLLIVLIGVCAVGAVMAKVRSLAKASVEVTDGSGPVDGHVYRIVNYGYGEAMYAGGAGNLTTSAINDDEEGQLWVAVANPKGEGFYMRNYKTGYYMTSSRSRSAIWQSEFTIQPDDDKILLTFIPVDGSYFIHTLSGYGRTDDLGTHGFAHQDGSHRVVCWNTASDNTKWNLVDQTEITPAMVAERKKSWLSCVQDIVPGKAYRLTNYNYGEAMATNNNALVAKTPDSESLDQVWLVENNPSGQGYLLRNYQSGKLATSSLAESAAWSMKDEYLPDQKTNVFYFNKRNNGFGIVAFDSYDAETDGRNYTYAHENNLKQVVGWTINSNPSIWLFNLEESISASDIEAQRQTWDCFKKNTVDNALAAIFADAACTELTPAYAAMNPEAYDTDPNVLALPEALRPMVKKVRTGDWSEVDPYNGNEWDSVHAKKFRVMLAEPFSESGGSSSLAGVQAHGDVNNPTGIVTDNGTVLYIMLDEEPAAGCEFRIAGRTGEGTPLATLNNTSDGVLLHKGLNVLQCDKDLADMIIYYTVRTNNRQRAVTDYKPIKVHFEGGSLNGYFNYEGDELYTPDTNEDWLYYRERARHAMFTLLSKYNTLYMHFHDLEDGTRCLKSLCSPEEYANGKFDLRATMKTWDQLYIAESLIMGWLPKEVIEAEKEAGRDYYDPLEGDPVAPSDFPKYLNNRHLGISLRECGFMNATWWRTAYNPGTISSIIREIPTGDFWGPAHEMGHLNQGPMNMAGCTEESNNVFSNVALFSRGQHTSRADYPYVQRERFNRGENFHQHSTWGTTRMWFQLWLYYHYVGHDKRFYPRLYELLRRNPLRRTVAPGHEGEENPMLAKDDLLHFAKMVCTAAGEDLTEFFEAWGFLVVQNPYYIGDYTSYTSYLSAEDIKEWREEIAALAKANNWKKNNAIIFIDDRVGSERQSYEFDKNKCGSMGGLKDFVEGAPVVGEYSFTISGTKIEITGATGGVGFIIHDDEGKLIGFANDPVFEVNEEAAAKIKEGKCTVEVICPDNTSVVVVDAVHNGTLEQKLEALDGLLEESRKVLARSDSRGLNPGYIQPHFVAGLQTMYDDVKKMREDNQVTADNNVALYDSLYEQYMAVRGITATEENTIQVRDRGVYVFTSNIKFPGLGIRANDAGTQLEQVPAEDVDMTDEAQQWVFEATDEEGYYYIRNVKYNKYICKAPADKAIVTLSDTPVKQYVKFRELGGLSISPEGSDHDSLHADDYNRLTRWDSSAIASRWGLTMLDNWEEKAVVSELEHWIAMAQKLLEEIAVENTMTRSSSWIVKEDYQHVTQEMVDALVQAIADATELLSKPSASMDDLIQITESLREIFAEVEEGRDYDVTMLKELLEKTGDLIDILGNYEISVDKIELNGDLLYSNACYNGGGGDQFNGWDVLLDGNVNTYFHSSYENKDTPDGLNHYIRIELPEVSTNPVDLVFTYNNRNNYDYNWVPAEAILESSADGENWSTIMTLAEELPYGNGAKFESVPFTVPAGTRYLRFMVNKNRQSEGSAGSQMAWNHPYFVLSELGISNYGISSSLDGNMFNEADGQIYKEAIKQFKVAANAFECPRFTNPRYESEYQALLPHYERLLSLYEKHATGIEEVGFESIESEKDQVIYTLDGVRVNKVDIPGVYIIDGRKVIVK
ncbi:MAG: M60 family metallopeptidase [Muribaculaceae bacterium]|nr:M60 family metallopeptidase [Muribaculaceae bacterium]